MLCQLNCRFYTNTIFAKEKSIVGNTCAQIFTDGEFVQITLMRSKSDPGTTLDMINRGDGVENDIFIYNTPRETDFNKEIQRVEV